MSAMQKRVELSIWSCVDTYRKKQRFTIIRALKERIVTVEDTESKNRESATIKRDEMETLYHVPRSMS